jgi:hypothetical protein
MSSGTTAIIIVVAVVVIGLIVAFVMTARRRRLQERFGPEYDRAVSEQDSRLRAEAELTERQRRVRKLNIQPLSAASRQRYLAQWQDIQERFVDSPEAAVTDAYALVTTVMRERGYPATDDEQAMADLSVEHGATVGHFRAAQEVAREAAHGSVGTEDLRQAVIHYRELFADLLGDRATALTADATTASAATSPADGSPVAGPEPRTATGRPAAQPGDELADDEAGAYAAAPTATGPNGLTTTLPDMEPPGPARITTPARDSDDPS